MTTLLVHTRYDGPREAAPPSAPPLAPAAWPPLGSPPSSREGPSRRSQASSHTTRPRCCRRSPKVRNIKGTGSS